MIDFFLSIEEAVKEFEIGYPRLRAWLDQGKLNRVKRGGRVCVIRGELEQLVYGVCHLCAKRFRRTTLRQRYCPGSSCRQNAHRFGLRYLDAVYADLDVGRPVAKQPRKAIDHPHKVIGSR